jgi:undecaprenyl diphosphate synthase
MSDIPKHIAIIMDGNGRWAKEKGCSRIHGHKAGSSRVREIVKCSGELGIKVLTLYAFSTENWKRPKDEVKALMELFLHYLKNEIKYLHSNNVVFRTIGDIEVLSSDLKKEIENAVSKTKNNTGLILNIAVNYGSRSEITRAVNNIIKKGLIHITEKDICDNLDTANLPDPDLLIRTGGEFRVSNFLLWQIAYAELKITPIYWPDFDENVFKNILEEYSLRERRFGGVNE